jgi:hypothetical protein
MARIPVYQEQQQLSQNVPISRVSAPDTGADLIGRSMKEVGQALGQVAKTMFDVEEENAKIWSANQAATAQMDWQDRMLKAQNAAAPDAANFTKSVMDDFYSWSQETLQLAPNNRAQKMLAQQLQRLKTSVFSNSVVFEQQQGRNYRFETTKDTVNKYGRMLLQNPDDKSLQTFLGTVEASIDALNDTPTRKTELKKYARNILGEAFINGQIERDPESVVRSMQTRPGTGFSNAVNFVLDAEGGFVAKDGVSGAPANFGINQRANPDIDVANLTKEQAAEIYRERYWNAVGANDLPPALAAAAFDTAVNMGVPTAKRLLAAAGGSPERLLQLRRAEYERIAASNPEQQKFLKGWMNRVDKLEKFVTSMPVGEEAPMTGRTGNPGLDLMDANKVPEKMRAAQVRANQARAVYRAELDQRVGDANAMAVNGITNPEQLSSQEFIKAYGAVDGMRRFSEYQDNQMLAADINKLQAMPVESMNAIVAASAPKPGPGYEMQAKRHSIMQQAAARSLKMRSEDPALYSLKSSETVNTAYSTFVEVMGNRSATDVERKNAATQYAAASIAEQTRLGITTPRLLSKSAVESIQQQFIGSTDGESIAVKIAAMEEMWGNNWPTVYKQLVQEKALPEAAIVIGSGMRGAPAADLAMASKMKTTELLVGLPSDTKKNLEESVSSELEDFRATMVGSDGSPRTVGSNQMFNLFFEETVRLAAYYRSQGMADSDAAKKAAASTVNNQYTFASTYRVPNRDPMSKQPIDPAMIEAGTNWALMNLQPERLFIPETNRRDAFVVKDYAKNIRRNGYWVTSENEDGLVLFNADSRSVVLDSSGNAILYLWAQLQDMGAPEDSQTDMMMVAP